MAHAESDEEWIEDDSSRTVQWAVRSGNGIVERAVQLVQGPIRTGRSANEEKWEVKTDVTHSVWPWIAEQEGFLLTRSEVGRYIEMTYERQ